jgi:hypothetical protein
MRVEEIDYIVDWKQFKPGYSFFIPCLAVRNAKREVRRVARDHKLKLFFKGVIEDGVRGLRVWRV